MMCQLSIWSSFSCRVHVAPNWAICAIEFVGETIITLDTEGYISWIPNVPASVVLQDEEMVCTYLRIYSIHTQGCSSVSVGWSGKIP